MRAAWEEGKEVCTEQTTDINSQLVVVQVVVVMLQLARTHTHTHAHTRTHTRAHTHARTHAHTHTHTCLPSVLPHHQSREHLKQVSKVWCNSNGRQRQNGCHGIHSESQHNDICVHLQGGMVGDGGGRLMWSLVMVLSVINLLCNNKLRPTDMTNSLCESMQPTPMPTPMHTHT